MAWLFPDLLLALKGEPMTAPYFKEEPMTAPYFKEEPMTAPYFKGRTNDSSIL